MSDLISRQDAIDALENEYCTFCPEARIIRQTMESLPSAQRKGKWIILDECANEGIYCSVCHKKVLKIDYSNTMKKWKDFKFCPNCGAKMEEPK